MGTISPVRYAMGFAPSSTIFFAPCHMLLMCNNDNISGKALLEKDSLDESIKHLQRANDLAREQKQNFGDDIAVQVKHKAVNKGYVLIGDSIRLIDNSPP